jgi:hypothetical protein
MLIDTPIDDLELKIQNTKRNNSKNPYNQRPLSNFEQELEYAYQQDYALGNILEGIGHQMDYLIQLWANKTVNSFEPSNSMSRDVLNMGARAVALIPPSVIYLPLRTGTALAGLTAKLADKTYTNILNYNNMRSQQSEL